MKRKASDYATNLAERRVKVCQISDFGKDLMFEILVRLPIKCLLRFKMVSKYWFGLIGSPEFIKFHLRKACDDPNYTQHKLMSITLCSSRAVLRQTPLYPTLCGLGPSSNRLRTEISHPMKFREEESQSNSVLKFVGSCSGLVCVVGRNNRLVIWNPALRKCKWLPYYGRGSSVFFGFGYDESNDDFKVVGIRCSRKTVVKIYSARTNSWKKLEEDGFEVARVRVSGHGCHLNGKLHWAANKSVFTVDLSTEQFGAIELPESPRVRECDDWNIHAVGEFLAVFCYYPTYPRDCDADLWILDDSWTRVNKSLDGYSGFKQITWFFPQEGGRPLHRIRLTPSEPGEAWRSIPIPGHMTGTAIMAFLFYSVKLDDYSFEDPRGIISDLGLARRPETVYVEGLVWPFQ